MHVVVTQDTTPRPTLDAIAEEFFARWVESIRRALYDIYGMRRGEFAATYSDADLRAYYADPECLFTSYPAAAVVMFRQTFTGSRSPFPETDETRRVRQRVAEVVHGRADAAPPGGVFQATVRLHDADLPAAVPEVDGFAPLVLPPAETAAPTAPTAPAAEFEL